MQRVTNNDDVQDLLSEVIEQVRNNEMSLQTAGTLINAAGKKVTAGATQMIYNKQMGKKEPIHFFESTKK